MPLGLLAGDFAIALDTLPGVCAGLAEGLRPRAALADDVEVHSGADAVARAAPAWRAIEEAGGLATPFQSLALAQAALPVHLARGEIPRIAVVRERGRPVAIFPTVSGRLAGVVTVRFLGDPLIQYGDLLAAPEARADHLRALWRTIADPATAGLVLLRKVRADARIAPAIASETRVLHTDEAPFVPLAGPCPRGQRDARELRRYRRRLAERGPIAFEVTYGAAAAETLREAIAVKRRWLAERGLVSTVIGDPDWEAALQATARHARAAEVAVGRLTVGGVLAAVEVGFVQGGRWYAFLGATVSDFVKAGPGHVAMAETIAHCRTRGLETYDLLAPAQPYKRTLAHDTVAVRDHARALTLHGHAVLRAACLLPAAKSAFAALPVGLRRLLARYRSGVGMQDKG